uniref:Lipoprotein signal peptidase n=1 Tax=Candidatus Kentrum sp. TC TaxID=2126339 RepID=A0A450Z293_9GAMM|nr:MAG: signal peptidase II Aspartic peptidase. MEROPS family A08 [Candidatus Kentron sp. TC]
MGPVPYRSEREANVFILPRRGILFLMTVFFMTDPGYADRQSTVLVRWLMLSVLVIILDQGTKYLVTTMLGNLPVPVSPFFNLALTYNSGAAFSFLSSAGGWQRWLFVFLSIVVSVILIHWLRGAPRGEIRLPMALALVLGGALGNLWDRLTLGAVIDFIDLHYRGWHWPTFNIADSAITVGALLLFTTLIGKSE